jgi:hypothetical protein
MSTCYPDGNISFERGVKFAQSLDQVSKDTINFFKDLAALQDTYGKALRKLASRLPEPQAVTQLFLAGGQSASNRVVTLALGVGTLKAQAEREGSACVAGAAALEAQVAGVLSGVRSQVSKDQKGFAAEGAAAVKDLEAARSGFQRAKKKLVETNVKLEQAQVAVQQHNLSVAADPKTAERLTAKAAQLLKERDSADAIFLASWHALVKERASYDRQMNLVMTAMGRAEEVKVEALAESMRAFNKVSENLLVAKRACIESCSEGFARLSARADLALFTMSEGPAQVAPPEPSYEPVRTMFEPQRPTEGGGAAGGAPSTPTRLVIGGGGGGVGGGGGSRHSLSSPSTPSSSRQSLSQGPVRPELASLKTVLAHEAARAAFCAYLESRWCSESLHFYQAVEQLPGSFAAQSPTALLAACHEIYNEFLARDSPREVNVADTVRSKVHATLHSEPFRVSPDPAVFHEARDICFKLMLDNSYADFLKSSFANY